MKELIPKDNSDEKYKNSYKKNNRKNTVEDEYSKLNLNSNLKNKSELNIKVIQLSYYRDLIHKLKIENNQITGIAKRIYKLRIRVPITN